MIRIFLILLLIVAQVTFFYTYSFGQNQYSKLSSLIPKEARDNGKLGVSIQSLTSGKTIFQHNPEKLFIPASNVKIITSAIALTLLKRDYKFKTELYSGGEIKNGVLHGGLYIKGYGDPTLNSEHMGYLVYHLKRRGIKEIRGGIFVDESFFDNVRYGQGWKDEWKREFYCPQISALSLNYNTFKIKVSASKLGSRPLLTIEPKGSNIQIINNARTSNRKQGIAAFWNDEKNAVVVKGRIRPKRTLELKLPVNDPAIYTGNVIKSYIEDAGIKIEGGLNKGQVPRWGNLFYTHNSLPLHLIINEYNKESVNIIGENLMKTIGAKYFGAPGTWTKGKKVYSIFLKELDIKNGFNIVDGSGLSLLNRVTPGTLTNILEYAYNSSKISNDFVSSLPIAGIDGTLKKRFKHTEIEGRVKAKTGYLNNVRALSGYIATKNDEVLAFSILSNGVGWKAKQYQQDILNELLDCCKSDYVKLIE